MRPFANPSEPPLHTGDHLDAEAFLRRWEAMPDQRFAQLIAGKVWLMPSPVSAHHANAHELLIAWCAHYRGLTPGLVGSVDATTQLGPDDVAQPDYQLNLPPHAGGRTHNRPDGYLAGPPDFVAEIAYATEREDAGEVARMYLRRGVREYLLWRVKHGVIDWWTHAGSVWQPIAPDDAGVLHSHVFPGLCMRPDLLIAGDLPGLFELVREACQHRPEHAALVARLNAER